MTETQQRASHRFEEVLNEVLEATPLMRGQKVQRLLSQVDRIVTTNGGVDLLYQKALALEEAGVFKDGPWEDPRKQVPTLVRGTLLAGAPNSSMEILSELRLLAYANGQKGHIDMPAEEAQAFLEEVLVHNLEFALDELTEESRTKLTQPERHKIVLHMRYLMDNAPLDGLKEKLAEEIEMVIAQKPIVTQSVRNIIQTIYQKMELDEDEPIDQRLQFFVNALYFPGPQTEEHPKYDDYAQTLSELDPAEFDAEVQSLGHYLEKTSLTNPYLAIALRETVQNRPDYLPVLLHLNEKGESEWLKYEDFVKDLVLTTFTRHHYRGIYGLKRMLERNLFSRRAVRAGITNLKLISFHPEVEKRVLKSVTEPHGTVEAKQYLMGALIGILGQPIGIGQGNNATCQSARGISMWAQHSPAKLINVITTVATANNLIMRFENQDLESMKLGKGLVDQLDYQLDAVSVIIVPHLDKIYNEMMRRASGRGEDPHKWVNPALYGQWIPSGFASAYSYLSNSIQDFEGFARLFLASFHPQYNGGNEMVYPNPIGIFITSSKGDMLGFHAVSLLRVAPESKAEDAAWRAYFLNPNNEGRQNWGQGIAPSVHGHGERAGESSLPVTQFLARTYAFHFERLRAPLYVDQVPDSLPQEAEQLARESWGKAYTWSNLSKAW